MSSDELGDYSEEEILAFGEAFLHHYSELSDDKGEQYRYGAACLQVLQDFGDCVMVALLEESEEETE